MKSPLQWIKHALSSCNSVLFFIMKIAIAYQSSLKTLKNLNLSNLTYIHPFFQGRPPRGGGWGWGWGVDCLQYPHFIVPFSFFQAKKKKIHIKLQHSQTKRVVNFIIKDKSIGGLMMDYKMSCLLQSRLARASVALLVSQQLEESWRMVLRSTTICCTSQLGVQLLETGFTTFLASISPTSYDQSINILHLHWSQYRSKKNPGPKHPLHSKRGLWLQPQIPKG